MKLFPPLFAFVVAAPCLGCIFVRPPPGAGHPYGSPSYGGSQYSGGGSSSPSNNSSSSGTTVNQSPPTQTDPHPAPAFVPSSLEMHSDCGKTLPIFLGEKPKFGSGTKSSIGSNTTTTFPRHPDGTMTVWIIDDSENGIASAFASPTTKRITVASNCTSLRAE